MEKWKVGFIGLGDRGRSLLKDILLERGDVYISFLCDKYPDRLEECSQAVLEKCGHTPKTTTEYKALIESPDVEVVVIASAWSNHVPAAVYAMECGKQVCTEVNGAYALEDCWRLVRAYEKTGIHCMMLENCCYDRRELMVMNMVRQGLFGKIVHCEGGYGHMQYNKSRKDYSRHFRIHEYKHRCCDTYPTHAIGPIAKIMDINRGNRMVRLNSVASGAWGMNEYARQHPDLVDKEYQSYPFRQGDIVKTFITCAHGETICLTLDTSLPRPYSRFFTVRGTRGCYCEDSDSVWLDTMEDENCRGNASSFLKEWDHPIWKQFQENGCPWRGHGGMDGMVMDAYFTSLTNGTVPPIDTYDTASWMAITPLSEASIAAGGAPVDFPDFTSGQWINRTERYEGFYSLDR